MRDDDQRAAPARERMAMYCGFGRQPGADGAERMREHARVLRAGRDARRY